MVIDPLVTQLAIVGCTYSIAVITFGAFELGVPAWKRVLKFLVTAGIMAALASRFGVQVASIAYLGIMAAGISFHIWWCRKNGIEILRPEPREKYYQLRGWTPR